jgi:PucR C-terminal helix-turn-helix domain
MTVAEETERATAQGIAGALLRDHERIVAHMVATINREVTEYGSADSASLVLQDLQAHCTAHLKSFFTSLQEENLAGDLDLGFVDEAIMRRVRQGIALDAILHAFRIGHQVAWASAIDYASAVDGGRSAALLMVQPSIRYIDTVSNRVAEVYLREQQSALAEADRVRRDVLELLIAGGPRAAILAHDAGIVLEAGVKHVLLAATISPSEDRDGLRVLAEEIAFVYGSAALLVVIRHGIVTGLVRVDGPDIVDAARQVVERYVVRRSAGAQIGISLETDDLADLGRANAEADSALRLTSSTKPVIALGQMPALEYLLAGADHIARSLVPPGVRSLALSTREVDAALVRTFEAYLASGLNVRHTAAALPAHPNTVHDRLRRLAERTGYDLRDVEQVMDLAIELRLGAQSPQPPARPIG